MKLLESFVDAFLPLLKICDYFPEVNVESANQRLRCTEEHAVINFAGQYGSVEFINR